MAISSSVKRLLDDSGSCQSKAGPEAEAKVRELRAATATGRQAAEAEVVPLRASVRREWWNMMAVYYQEQRQQEGRERGPGDDWSMSSNRDSNDKLELRLEPERFEMLEELRYV